MKKILVWLCLLIAVGNAAAASSIGYISLLAGRLLSGFPHGAYFGVAAIVASEIAPESKKAGAVSIMVSGMTVANVLGVPLATFLANAISWRCAFALVAAFGIIALLSIVIFVPAVAPSSENGDGTLRGQFSFLKTAAPWLIIAGAFFGPGAIYCWFSYVEPLMIHIGHFSKDEMTWVMMLAGMGMVAGGLLSGKLSDRFKPGIVAGCASMLAIPVLALIYFCSADPRVSLCLTFAGSACQFGIVTPLQYLIVRFAPGGELLGGAMIQIAFNASNACAAYLGGCAISAGLGLSSPALMGIPFAIGGIVTLFYFTKRYGM